MEKVIDEKHDSVLPHRALYLCNGENTACKKSGCALLGKGECKRTTNVIYAKNGPVKDVREWETRFIVVEQNDGLLYYCEKENNDAQQEEKN